MNKKQLEQEILSLKQRVSMLEKILKDLNNQGVNVDKDKSFSDNQIEAQNESQTLRSKNDPLTKVANRDKTKYVFEGKVLPKNRLVLAIIKKYVEQNPQTTISNLQEVFDKSLQGSLMVVEDLEVVKKISDYQKRYFSNEGDMITLKDGVRALVCTQWGIFNINKFIFVAKSLGFNIEEI